MTFADLEHRHAYRVRGRGHRSRYYLLTSGGNWREVPAPPVDGLRVTLADVRAVRDRMVALRDWAPGELAEAWGR